MPTRRQQGSAVPARREGGRRPQPPQLLRSSTTKLLALAAAILAAVYGMYLLSFILHTQTIAEVYSIPEHRGAGQREEWGLKNRGVPAGLLPLRPKRLSDGERKKKQQQQQQQQQRGHNAGVPTDEKSQLLRKAKHASDIVKPIGHDVWAPRPLPGEAGGAEPPSVPHVLFQTGNGIVHGRAGPITAGVVDAEHLHGTVGVDATSGRPLWEPLPDLDWSKETRAEKALRHANTCFNLRRSDSLPLDRPLGDKRAPECAALVYDYHNLPKTSVVMVFFNEPLSPLYRSIVSVLDRTPPELLHEIILIDDGSDATWLQPGTPEREEFHAFIQSLPKVHLKRIARSGLMVARTQGALVATGETLTFLDSHVEATRGWLEPLMARIADSPKHVVMPQIDGLDADTFAYRVGGIDILGFSWTLGQKGLVRPRSVVEPMPSPIMAGGLFSMDRLLFYDLGTYDQDMRLYGGEEMEISFRIWQCGFTLECIPCSHVGHVFRSGEFWHGQVYDVPSHEITRNKLRAAEAWMDEYAQLVHRQSPPLPAGNPVGDLAQMRAVRDKFQCKSFQWYLDNVYPESFIPRQGNAEHVGHLVHRQKDVCLASPRRVADGIPLTTEGKARCLGTQTNSFLFMLTSTTSELRSGAATFMEWCVDSANGAQPQLYHCHGGGGNQAWSFDDATGFLTNGNRCLGLVTSGTGAGAGAGVGAEAGAAELRLSNCNGDPDRLRWDWVEKLHALPLAAVPNGDQP